MRYTGCSTSPNDVRLWTSPSIPARPSHGRRGPQAGSRRKLFWTGSLKIPKRPQVSLRRDEASSRSAATQVLHAPRSTPAQRLSTFVREINGFSHRDRLGALRCKRYKLFQCADSCKRCTLSVPGRKTVMQPNGKQCFRRCAPPFFLARPECARLQSSTKPPPWCRFNILTRDARSAEVFGERLNTFARRLEVEIYRSASSLVRAALAPCSSISPLRSLAATITAPNVQEEYADKSTLKHRVKRIAKTLQDSSSQPSAPATPVPSPSEEGAGRVGSLINGRYPDSVRSNVTLAFLQARDRKKGLRTSTQQTPSARTAWRRRR
jgi:hypothetical protein